MTVRYDKLEQRFDGMIAYTSGDLSDEQLLFITLGGRVAELLARTEGHWDVTAIHTRILSGEYGDTRDMQHVRSILSKIPTKDKQEQVVTETIFYLCSYLQQNWSLVLRVASDILRSYSPETRQATISYDDLSVHTKEQLMQLRNTE